MKFLVIGLGSMGKRRIRNLISLGHKKNIAGFDLRVDRREEVQQSNILVFDDFENALHEFQPDIFIISTPPDLHMNYAYIAKKNGIHCFIEASVVDSDKILHLAHKIKDKEIIMAPSCTMQYFPMAIKIKELVSKKTIGKVLNYNYHTGQYLPDWHPWEKIEDFYVSNPHTGGCREIVPFELTWLNNIFGDSKPLACVKRKLTNINAEIDDIYHCILEYPEGIIGNLTVEVISQPKDVRDIRIIGTDGEIKYDADSNILKYINTQMDSWEEITLETGTIEEKYINPEEPYINEIKDFLDTVTHKDKSYFPNTLEKDYKILETLYKLEEISGDSHELSR